MMRRILVTGGAGFIGSHIVAKLIKRGFSIVVIDNESTGKRANVHPEAKFIAGDVRNPADLAPIFGEGVDAVLHIAGQASIRLSFSNPTADLNVNTLGTINVLQQCIEHHVPRLIFASSMTIYGNTGITPTPETTAPDPVSYYAITKYAAERYVHTTVQRRDLGFDFNVTSMRMFNVYGAGQSLTNAYQGVFAIFIGNVLRGEPIKIHADGEQSRDFVHIDDVTRAWVDAIDNPASYGQVINIGTGKPTSVNTLADVVLSAFGYTRASYPVEYHPAQPGDMRHSAADIRQAKTLLGWSPQVDLDDGMRTTIEWARGQV
jgi:UDP-glucose 4-epimerase